MEILRLYVGSINGVLGPGTPVHCYVVKHPQGIVLVDTGFGETLGGPGPVGSLSDRDGSWARILAQRTTKTTSETGASKTADQDPRFSISWVRRSTEEALADHGIDIADVKWVINTHIGDHSGENYIFKQATFIVQRIEVEAIRRARAFLDTWDFPNAKFQFLDGEDEEVLPDIVCLFTPGHSPGHQSVLLEGGTRTLLVGDAIYTADIWKDPESMTEAHPAWDGQGANPHWFASAKKLRAIGAEVVHFSHDSTVVRSTMS